MSAPEVEVLLPIHNEAASIEATLVEIHRTVSPVASMRFLLCEDGSTDGTPDVLQHLTAALPLRLFTSPHRKGYARAVIDGLRHVEAPFVLCLDSDGQVDPGAFLQAWPMREQGGVIVGWRRRRADPLYRKLMSRAFRTVYRMVFHVPVHDPSCPFVVIRRDVLDAVVDDLGILKQGFWWEFMARAAAAGFRVAEIPVHHRPRAAGRTRVYGMRQIPGIAWSHLVGLLVIKRQVIRTRQQQFRLDVDS